MSDSVEFAKLERLVTDASEQRVPLCLTLRQYEQTAPQLHELRERLWSDDIPNNDVELIINSGDYNVDRNWSLISPADKEPEVDQ